MAHRTIVDDRKQVWDVWEVIPARLDGAVLTDEPYPPRPRRSDPVRRLIVPESLQAGWLAFQCGEERRRLAPPPAAWHELSDLELLRLMTSATPIHRKTERTS